MAWKSVWLFVLAAAALLAGTCQAEDQNRWALTVYGAVLAKGSLENTLRLAAPPDDSYRLLALALSRRITRPNRHLDIEVEGQFVQHFGGQNHQEVNGVLIARWRTFPWNRILPTSVAVGEGLSFASEIPQYERLKHEESSQILNYLMFELAVDLPFAPRFALVARVHHRSGVYGLFDNVHGASNFSGLGFKYRF